MDNILMNNDYFLTIYVLAYENANCVHQLLDSAVTSLPNDTRIIIADNSDRTDSVKRVYDELSSSLKQQISYFQHKTNNGSIASIMKAFEIINSNYLWLVGACNRFNSTSIQTVSDVLKSSNPDALLIFENNLWRKKLIQQPVLYSDYVSLLKDHSYSVICSINSTIYNTSKFRRLQNVGYEAMSSLAPHAAMIIEGLRSQKITVLYTPLFVINRPVRERVWSTRKFLRHITAIFPGYVPDSEITEFLNLLNLTDEWIHIETTKMSSDPNYGYEIKEKKMLDN